jgi:hypothetical protein
MLRPESRGQVLLVSAEPTAATLIRQNFLATERDRRTMREIIDPSPAACAERKRAVEDGEYEKLSTEVKDLHWEAGHHVGLPVGQFDRRRKLSYMNLSGAHRERRSCFRFSNKRSIAAIISLHQYSSFVRRATARYDNCRQRSSK